jgi:hypothetical protein
MLTTYLLCLSFRLPSPGNTYLSSFNVPIVGSQSVQMDILNKSYVKITLNGFIKSCGLVEFTGIDEKGAISFIVHDPLLSITKKYRCSITSPKFDEDNDSVHINLGIRPLFWSKQLDLERI